MKKNYLKMLLAAVCMVVGSSAWADKGDVTINANIDFSSAISTQRVVVGAVDSMVISGPNSVITNGRLFLYDETGTVTIPSTQYAGDMDTVKVSFKKAWGNKNGMGSGFRLKDKDGEVIVNFQHARWGGGSNNLNVDMSVSGLMGAHYGNAPIVDRYTLFDISINYAEKKITTVVSCPYNNATKTFVADLTNTNPVATFEAFAYGVGGNQDRADMFDDLMIQTVEGDYDVSYSGYTVNWICDGTVIKTDSRLGITDSAVELTSSDLVDFVDNGQKYIYVSNDLVNQKADGTAVVNITMREAEAWTYTVKAVCDEIELKTLYTGTVAEGDAATYYYPQYINVGDVLYISSKQGANPWWGKTFTPTMNNEEQIINYAVEGEQNIVFCKEAEEIEGLTVISSGNTDIRASHGAGAYAATEDVVITTLPAGKYKVYSATYGNAGITFNIMAGDQIVLTMTTNGNPVHTAGEEFTLGQATDIILAKGGNGGNSPKTVDYIIIQKTGDVTPASVTATIGDCGYSTFCSENALDLDNLPEGLTAYYVADNDLSDGYVTLTPATGAVQGGVGLILAGEAGEDYEIPFAEVGSLIAGNRLKGVTAADVAAGANEVAGPNVYVLVNQTDPTSTDGGSKAVFSQLSGEEEVAIPAGKAYLELSVYSGSKLRIKIAGEGDATAIGSVEAAEQAAEGAIFNVAGQRVNGAYKGIVIKNGKKVLNR